VKTDMQDSGRLLFIIFVMGLVLTGFLMVDMATAQTAAQKLLQGSEKKDAAPTKEDSGEKTPLGPQDEFERGIPRTSLKGFLDAARDGEFERAAEFLDLRYLPGWIKASDGPELAKKLKIVIDRKLFIDLGLISNHPLGDKEDGLPYHQDIFGRIKTPRETVDMIIHKVPRDDGVFIWKISNKTVSEIPYLWAMYGYKPFEEALAKIFPDVVFIGWYLWQWVAALISAGLCYLIALLLTWFAGWLIKRKETDLRLQVARFAGGPARILIWFLLADVALNFIGPSTSIRRLMNAQTIMTIAFAWALIRMLDILFDWWTWRIKKTGQEETTVLLQPVRKVLKILIGIFFALLWLDNIGFNVSTLLAGLGVGGIAIALAAQDTLKNFLGSIMILLDKPYQIGQRIVVKGHDGVVEEIGLRSTKLRLLSGHQTAIPNEEMARTDIENIGRRPHIRRLTNIAIPYNTPVGKVEKAVQIINDILKDHEGMRPDLPPRVYFNEFNRDSLNIIILYWYHPPDYWGFLAFNQGVNMQIMKDFEAEGIKFAFPTTTNYLAQDADRAFQFGLPSEGVYPPPQGQTTVKDHK
jgi:MscS family membrane protein